LKLNDSKEDLTNGLNRFNDIAHSTFEDKRNSYNLPNPSAMKTNKKGCTPNNRYNAMNDYGANENNTGSVTSSV